MTESLIDPQDLSGFAGVFPANPTPTTASGEVHEKALQAILEDNITHGAGGFWLAGTSGEGPLLSETERDRVSAIAGDVTRGRALAIMNVGAITTSTAVKGARGAARAGCAAIACLPPFLIKASQRSIIDHYKAVAEAAEGLPLFAYNVPQLTYVNFDRPLMEALRNEVPTLIGLKHSAPDLGMIRTWTEMGLACFSGFGQLALPALAMGAVGSIDAPLSIAPWLYADLYTAWKAGDLETARSRQDSIQAVVELTERYGAVSHTGKTILGARIGTDCGVSIAPNNRLTEEQRRSILTHAEALGLLNPADGK